ncbi:MAG: putative ABC transporter permease [Clostridium sp.]|nr:putative ABC transporter permease [Clostridium sp.]
MDILYFIIFNFIIYSFLGWIIEEIYCFTINRTFKKSGFLRGPIKPMYGIAMTTLVLCYYVFMIRGIFMAILFFIIPSTVEYVSAYLMKRVFNEVYWRYDRLKFNINGYVCLKFSLYWMFLSFVGVHYFQPVLNNFYIIMDDGYLKVITISITMLSVLDFILKVKEQRLKLYLNE